MEEVKSDKRVVYGLGSPDPIRFDTSFAGADIKVTFELKDGTVIYVPELQAIALTRNPNTHMVQGRIITLLFDEDRVDKYRDTIENIKLVAANERETIAICKICHVGFEESSWTVSIDDLVAEVHTNFIAKSATPWKRPGK